MPLNPLLEESKTVQAYNLLYEDAVFDEYLENQAELAKENLDDPDIIERRTQKRQRYQLFEEGFENFKRDFDPFLEAFSLRVIRS